MSQILIKAIYNFRKAIENACDDRELTFYPFYMFPKNCCDMTSELLAQFLYDMELDTVMIIGSCYEKNEHHVWLEAANNMIIDITADQFNNRRDIGIKSHRVILGGKTQIHAHFGFDIKAEEPICKSHPINDKRYIDLSDRREKDLYDAYKIIMKHYIELAC